MISVLRHGRRVAAAAVVALVAGRADVRADDVVVEEQPRPAAGWRMQRGAAEQDLGQLFDSRAFAGAVFTKVGSDAADAKPAADEIAAPLVPVRRRMEAKIATVDRIVGLSETQRKKLRIAVQSDLRQLNDTLLETRAKYAGRTLKRNPDGGFDDAGQKAMQQAVEDGARCGRLVQAACGSESLLAKVIVGTLDDEQAKKYTAVMQGRAACRWRAVVAAGLAQLDGQAGFTQKQHDALASVLFADVPPFEEEPTVTRQPAGMQVAQRIAAVERGKLAAILDPRQVRMVEVLAERGQVMVDPM
jgi:hypothetical protein